jgi:hypothetical protein
MTGVVLPFRTYNLAEDICSKEGRTDGWMDGWEKCVLGEKSFLRHRSGDLLV